MLFDPGYLGEAVGGPGTLRFVIQPLFAVILGIRDGRRDARSGRMPYLFHLLTGSGERKDILGEGMRQVLAPLCAGFAVDVLVRLSLGFGFHPLASSVVGVMLVGVPYILARSAADRILRR